jgi:Tfp pilus assembly protein PilO
MKLAPRETMLTLATAAVALFAISYMAAKPKLESMKEIELEQINVRKQIQRDRETIAEKKKWDKEYEGLRKMLPTLPAGRNTDVHWLELMDNIAGKNGIKISKRQAGEEKKLGEVYELPVECKEWEGSLDSLAHFLFDIQNEGAMLDVRQLRVKPQGKDLLRGSFTLYCAYMKESQATK